MYYILYSVLYGLFCTNRGLIYSGFWSRLWFINFLKTENFCWRQVSCVENSESINFPSRRGPWELWRLPAARRINIPFDWCKWAADGTHESRWLKLRALIHHLHLFVYHTLNLSGKQTFSVHYMLFYQSIYRTHCKSVFDCQQSIAFHLPSEKTDGKFKHFFSNAFTITAVYYCFW